MKMIIVDDERIGREGMIDFIDWSGDYGIEIVGTAANGQEGYELYQAVNPDIVLTDIKMPVMSGIELAEKIRGINKKVRIILLSAYSDFSYAQQAFKSRVDDYLLKPIDEPELRLLLEQITAESNENHQRENAKQQFLDVLGGNKEHCEQLRDYTFQVFSLGKQQKHSCSIQDLWLLEYYEGVQVGIARYPRSEKEPFCGCPDFADFESCYAGSRVDQPEEIFLSYNEAVLSSHIGTYWELKELDYEHIVRRRGQWMTHHTELKQEAVKLADAIRSAIICFERTKVEITVQRIMHYLRQYSGVDPAYIEEFLVWIVTRIAQDFADFQEMKTSLWELKISLQNQDRFHKIKPALSHWLLEWTERAEEKRQLPETTIVQLVMNIVEQEYHQDINLRSLAERVYLSPNYLGNLFRHSTSLYFNDYLASYRMEKARELLLTSSDKVTQIGEAVGIPNTSYFSSLFKKTFGVTPKEYRRTHCE